LFNQFYTKISLKYIESSKNKGIRNKSRCIINEKIQEMTAK